ncbi:MAG: hypothetical protein JW934_17415 [Anaerolineae bacterium]|nr:hypothetical protein [Anaerolineae bacterium]
MVEPSTSQPSASPGLLERIKSLLTPVQWIIVFGLGLILIGLVAATALVIWRAGQLPAQVTVSPGTVSVAMLLPTPTPVLPYLVPDAVPTPSNLYWPAEPQPLAVPNAPSNLLWWNAQYLYRRPILLDVVAAEAPAGTWVRVLFDGAVDQQQGRMRSDVKDLRIVVWDGARWWEIPRLTRMRSDKPGWEIIFHVQDSQIAQRGGYYLYYGNLYADDAPIAEDAPQTSRLLLALGERESVEWGPEITWTAHSTATQTLVSPDGRIVIQCPPGGPETDVRVRVRTVPLQESKRDWPLAEYELHAEPMPGPSNPHNVAHWIPSLRVTLNWAGLPVDVRDLDSRVHFEYDINSGIWYSVPVDFDARRGLTILTTEQP